MKVTMFMAMSVNGIIAGEDGSANNTSFAKEGLIDEIIVNVDSVVIGKGIQLFKPEDFSMQLHLKAHKQVSPTVIQLHYEVIKG